MTAGRLARGGDVPWRRIHDVQLCLALLVALSVSSICRADGFSSLRARVAADVGAGRPLVVETHVALCDNRQIPCGSRALGDGDALDTNLYWATTGGLRGWIERRGSGWTRAATLPGDGDILETRIYRRRVDRTEIVWIAHAWRGAAIARALQQFVDDVAGQKSRDYAVGGQRIHGGGAAHLVAYVGHNGWMDLPRVAFPPVAADELPKGVLAVACYTESWLRPFLPHDRESPRVPLVLTADLLFAGSATVEGAVLAFARGGDLTAIRSGAITGYSESEGKPAKGVRSLFTNASDPRWKH
jgi:hypothetical protein